MGRGAYTPFMCVRTYTPFWGKKCFPSRRPNIILWTGCRTVRRSSPVTAHCAQTDVLVPRFTECCARRSCRSRGPAPPQRTSSAPAPSYPPLAVIYQIERGVRENGDSVPRNCHSGSGASGRSFRIYPPGDLVVVHDLDPAARNLTLAVLIRSLSGAQPIENYEQNGSQAR